MTSSPLRVIPLATTRLAVLGCIYGNLPAMRACIQDARIQGCGAIVCAGDAVGFCGHSPEVIDMLITHCAVNIAGNHERAVAEQNQSCGCGHADPEAERLACLAASPQHDGINDAHRAWMASLPEQVVVATPGGRILLCHGSPDRIDEFLYANTCDRVRARGWLDRTGAVVVACSHSGLPWQIELDDRRLVVNCGSVGRPDHDGDPAIHYAIVDLSGPPRAELRRVDYDHQAWTAHLLESGIDPRFAQQLTTGRWVSGYAHLPL